VGILSGSYISGNEEFMKYSRTINSVQFPQGGRGLSKGNRFSKKTRPGATLIRRLTSSY